MADGQEAQVAQRARLWGMVAALGGPVRGGMHARGGMSCAAQAEPPAEEEAANGHEEDGAKRRREDEEGGDDKRAKTQE